MRNHIALQGEHLSGIAEKYGFHDYRLIWNHPENSDLKNRRTNPNVLFPGDLIAIPDKRLKEVGAASDKRHTFILHKQPLMLKLVVERIYYKPFANAACELMTGLDNDKLTTDSDGALQDEISKTTVNARLTIHDKFLVRDVSIPIDVEVPILVGHLDPVDKVSGQQARLSNLGYYRLTGDKVDDAEFKSAVEEFQCENGLPVNGICDSRMQDRLKEIHGA
jgi:Putative peptidoglycan binding domain